MNGVDGKLLNGYKTMLISRLYKSKQSEDVFHD